MQIYFAPMEGLTDALYRRTHHACFSGVDKYFMPFVSPSASLSFTLRTEADISPAQNAGVPAVPQILARNPDYFNGMAQVFAQAGYTEVNLNAGCPSGTATGKGKGAGLLQSPDELARFLDAIFARPPLPISIKARIGWERPEEWPRLMEIFARYPLHELILHPRTRKEGYAGSPHRECYAQALSALPYPVVYNGDLFSLADCQAFAADFPHAPAVMLGRGLAGNPALAQTFTGGAPLTLEALERFHRLLFSGLLRTWPRDAAVGHMHLIMQYLCACFENSGKAWRAIRRATMPEDYEDAAALLFACPLREAPAFSPAQYAL